MKDGNKEFENLLLKADGYASWYEERDPGLSNTIYTLIRIIQTMDKNQKALIKLLLKYQRENKVFEQMTKRIYRTMYRELKHIGNVWTGGDAE